MSSRLEIARDMLKSLQAGQEPKAEEREMDAVERLKLAMSIMDYNQSFINFADGKANALLLVNSIFLASAAAKDTTAWTAIVTVLTAAVAILFSLSVVYARMPGNIKRDRSKIVFWGHIHLRRNRAEYQNEFMTAKTSEVLEGLTKQIYDLCQVVDRKFRAYGLAQLATLLTAACWVTNLLLPFLQTLAT